MANASESETLAFPILIGDIGGTNARFWILSDAKAEPQQFPNVRTADFANIDDALAVKSCRMRSRSRSLPYWRLPVRSRAMKSR